MSKKNLSFTQLLLCGGALFSMHFGASSMVWPMNWGKESGSSVYLAFLGAFITSLLLVLICYIALARSNRTYNVLVNHVIGNKVGTFYAWLSIIILGPLYAIPRMSAASWDSITQALKPFSIYMDGKLYLICFTILFYIVSYIFCASSGKAMDRISSILFPVLLIVIILVISKGLLNPMGEQVEKVYEQSAFAYGFTNGYATAEILCALIFGAVIFDTLKSKGIDKDHRTRNMIYIGIIGIAMLSCTHLAHMIIGSYSSESAANLQYTSLYTKVVSDLYGKYGGILFSLALFFAALTTAIGMTSGCAHFFVDATGGDKKKYKFWALVISILSTVIGCLGLTNMLSWLGPILDAVYPTAIILVLYYAFFNLDNPKLLYACRFATYTTFVFGLADALYKYSKLIGFDKHNIFMTYLKLPLAEISLAWVPCTIVVFLVSCLVYQKKYSK